MMNMGENRVQNGVTDCPESRNEVSVEKWEKWPSRYAEEELRSLRASGTFRSHPGTFIRGQIIFLPTELLQIRLNSIMELKVLILELYLVNPYNEALRYVPTGNILRTELDVRKELDTAMNDQGERYIYQRFPYVVLDDTPSDSSGADSDPDEALSVASQATPAAPRTPSAPRPVTPPPPAPAHQPAPMPSPPRVPAWDGLRRMRGQARKTTGLPPRHQMAQRDEPSTQCPMRLSMWWDGIWAGRRLDPGVCPIYKHTELDDTGGVNEIKAFQEPMETDDIVQNCAELVVTIRIQDIQIVVNKTHWLSCWCSFQWITC
ncbi:hypothetical protein E3N88_01197 [Mikania micrantha]|uniref:Uncharacterized protein n=1 Tax=Mikania micrantha TaxID=192012 RepID=A0A5N6Q275_9ASTR|nr:hypothetical protein E3N88_01197 [Mikania micrantha]